MLPTLSFSFVSSLESLVEVREGPSVESATSDRNDERTDADCYQIVKSSVSYLFATLQRRDSEMDEP